MPADRTADLVARASRINGRGVFARRALPARRKVGEVTGQLVRLPAARRRVENRRRIFLVELSTRTALDCSAGNVLRHLNHACAPNCYLRVRGYVADGYRRVKLKVMPFVKRTPPSATRSKPSTWRGAQSTCRASSSRPSRPSAARSRLSSC